MATTTGSSNAVGAALSANTKSKKQNVHNFAMKDAAGSAITTQVEIVQGQDGAVQAASYQKRSAGMIVEANDNNTSTLGNDNHDYAYIKCSDFDKGNFSVDPAKVQYTNNFVRLHHDEKGMICINVGGERCYFLKKENGSFKPVEAKLSSSGKATDQVEFTINGTVNTKPKVGDGNSLNPVQVSFNPGGLLRKNDLFVKGTESGSLLEGNKIRVEGANDKKIEFYIGGSRKICPLSNTNKLLGSESNTRSMIFSGNNDQYMKIEIVNSNFDVIGTIDLGKFSGTETSFDGVMNRIKSKTNQKDSLLICQQDVNGHYIGAKKAVYGVRFVSGSAATPAQSQLANEFNDRFNILPADPNVHRFNTMEGLVKGINLTQNNVDFDARIEDGAVIIAGRNTNDSLKLNIETKHGGDICGVQAIKSSINDNDAKQGTALSIALSLNNHNFQPGDYIEICDKYRADGPRNAIGNRVALNPDPNADAGFMAQFLGKFKVLGVSGSRVVIDFNRAVDGVDFANPQAIKDQIAVFKEKFNNLEWYKIAGAGNEVGAPIALADVAGDNVPTIAARGQQNEVANGKIRFTMTGHGLQNGDYIEIDKSSAFILSTNEGGQDRIRKVFLPKGRYAVQIDGDDDNFYIKAAWMSGFANDWDDLAAVDANNVFDNVAGNQEADWSPHAANDDNNFGALFSITKIKTDASVNEDLEGSGVAALANNLDAVAVFTNTVDKQYEVVDGKLRLYMNNGDYKKGDSIYYHQEGNVVVPGPVDAYAANHLPVVGVDGQNALVVLDLNTPYKVVAVGSDGVNGARQYIDIDLGRDVVASFNRRMIKGRFSNSSSLYRGFGIKSQEANQEFGCVYDPSDSSKNLASDLHKDHLISSQDFYIHAKDKHVSNKFNAKMAMQLDGTILVEIHRVIDSETGKSDMAANDDQNNELYNEKTVVYAFTCKEVDGKWEKNEHPNSPHKGPIFTLNTKDNDSIVIDTEKFFKVNVQWQKITGGKTDLRLGISDNGRQDGKLMSVQFINNELVVKYGANKGEGDQEIVEELLPINIFKYNAVDGTHNILESNESFTIINGSQRIQNLDETKQIDSLLKTQQSLTMLYNVDGFDKGGKDKHLDILFGVMRQRS